MAKKKQTNEEDELPRQNRREQLLKRKQDEQLRQLRIGGGIILGLIGLIIITALVVEFLVVPRQAVAEIRSETITISEFQEMVKYQRAQLITGIENQYQEFLSEDPVDQEQAEQDALRFVQQFSGQQIQLLAFQSEQLGEFVLDQMVDDALIRQGATDRGITVSEAEIEGIIGERYNFFNGESPTPFPTPTTGPEPTPSVTPIGFVDTALETEDGEEPAAELPTSTPFPTATPVSREFFEEELNSDLEDVRQAGGNPDVFRTIALNAVYREKMAEALFVEQEVPTRVPHTSAFILAYDTQEAAEAALAEITGLSFLDVWNVTRSLPAPEPVVDSEGTVVAQPVAEATERLWLTEDQYGSILPVTVVEALFSLPVGQPSAIIAGADMQTGAERFYVIQVNGREDRDLDQFTILNQQQELLTNWLNEERISGVTIYENWRTRVPRTPSLDTFFTNPAATVTPQPTIIIPTVEPVPVEGGDSGDGS